MNKSKESGRDRERERGSEAQEAGDLFLFLSLTNKLCALGQVT